MLLSPKAYHVSSPLSLAGKPKKPNALKTICLMLGPDFITDIIEVRICDFRILFVPWCSCACNHTATCGGTMVVSTAAKKKKNQKKDISCFLTLSLIAFPHPDGDNPTTKQIFSL